MLYLVVVGIFLSAATFTTLQNSAIPTAQTVYLSKSNTNLEVRKSDKAENMTNNLVNFKKTLSFDDFTLIIPSVSVGNVPQLTADLIIATHALEKVAILWHPAFIPSVGGDPYGSDPNAVSTAVELFASEPLKLAVIQVRSGIDIKFALHFFRQLETFIVEQRFRDLVILSSTSAYELRNVRSEPFRFVSNQNVMEKMELLGIAEMDVANERFLFHGAGFTEKLFKALGDTVNYTVLVKYVSEGDNRRDAYLMLEVLYKLVDNFKDANVRNIKCPSSWEFVFGSPPPAGLY